MPRPKKERGRPMQKGYPPRIDATPEQIAEAFFRFPVGQDHLEEEREYQCGECGEAVKYPAVLNWAGRCSGCAQAST